VASRQSAIDTGDYDGRPLRRLHELAARPSLIRGCCLIRKLRTALRIGRNFEK